MKQVILDVLEDVSQGQVNLESEAAREMIVNLIMASIKTKGWHLDLGKAHHDGKLDTAGHPVKKIDKWLTRDIDEAVIHYVPEAVIHEEQIKDTWVCMICNKSTYDVDWNYLGSGTNHLECELKQESKKLNEEKKYK